MSTNRTASLRGASGCSTSGGHSPTTLVPACVRLVLLLLVCASPAGADEQRLPGKFVWSELVTYDIAASEQFYGPLFDWRFEDHDGYRVAWRGDEPIGGLVHRARRDPAAKSRWIAYMSVEDMATVKASLLESGAKMLADSRTIEGLGALAVFADREGALFGIIDTAVPDPGDYMADIGSWIWLQLFSRDTEQASQFYERIGGYQRVADSRNPGSYLLLRGGYARAALSMLPLSRPDANPSWVPFLRVADIAATLEQSTALGGKILVAPRPDLYDGRVAMIEAPDGSAVGIMVWESQAGEEAP